MLFEIHDGRRNLWQWDLGARLRVTDPTISEVHFGNRTGDCSLVVEVKDLDGVKVAAVPNILLQSSSPLTVFAYVRTEDGGYTREVETFAIIPRSRPDDYVYTETEAYSFKVLEERIAKLEESGGIFYGTDDTDFAEWLAEYEAGKLCIWKNRSLQGMVPRGDFTLCEVTRRDDGRANCLTFSCVGYGRVWSVSKYPSNVTGSKDFNLSDFAKTAQIPEIPEALPNPARLVFTGAVNTAYDGSQAVTVNIPTGGGDGTGGGSLPNTVYYDVTPLESIVAMVKNGVVPVCAKPMGEDGLTGYMFGSCIACVENYAAMFVCIADGTQMTCSADGWTTENYGG